jgi:malate dehydrogenase (oxaloacetate-decarboxylating)
MRGRLFTEVGGTNGAVRIRSHARAVDQQVSRCYERCSTHGDDVSNWAFLTDLHDRDGVLFDRLVGDHVEEMLPIVGTPTVGAAIEQFRHVFRRPRGAFLHGDDADGIDRAFRPTKAGSTGAAQAV